MSALVAGTCAEPALRAYCRASGLASTCVPELVTAQAMRRPRAVALTQSSRILTYDQLDCQANRLAHHLRSLGVAAGIPVGLCVPEPLEMAAGSLGILKAGGACVPMDPAYPPDRLTFMLEDLGAPILVTTSTVSRRLSTAGCEVVSLDRSQMPERDYPPRIYTVASDVACVIQASGSTCEPRRVEITHASLSNLVSWHRHAFAVTPADRTAQVAGGPDAAAWELWPYLTAGASVHPAGHIAWCAPELLRDWLLEQRITICSVPRRIAERLVLLEWPQQTPLRVLLTGDGTLAHDPPSGLAFRIIDDYDPVEWMAGTFL